MKETALRTAIAAVEKKDRERARQRRKRRIQVNRRKWILYLTVFFLCIHAGGLMMVNAFADETGFPVRKAHYACIQLEPGDSLWSLASRYSQGSPMDTREYVRENYLHKLEYMEDQAVLMWFWRLLPPFSVPEKTVQPQNSTSQAA